MLFRKLYEKMDPLSALTGRGGASSGRLAGAQVETADVEGISGGEIGGAHDEEDEEDEPDHLDQMVANARKRRGWRPAGGGGGGGGGGGSHRGSRSSGRRRNKGKGGNVD